MFILISQPTLVRFFTATEVSTGDGHPGMSSQKVEKEMPTCGSRSPMSSEELRVHGNQLKTQFHKTGDDSFLNCAIDGENFDF